MSPRIATTTRVDRGGLLELAEALEPPVEHPRVISREHLDRDEYRAAVQGQGKVLLRVTPERWGPVASGGVPPGL